VAADSAIDIRVVVTGKTRRLGTRAERALYRIAHEALANAWRHAQCTTIDVEVTFTAGEVVLVVADDGKGKGDGRAEVGDGTGTSGMRRAMADLGGVLRVGRRPPRGWVVEARIPREHVR
jgi:signal transduction histidine kinase